MTYRKNDIFEKLLWKLILVFGGLWLLNKILEKPTGAVAINGVPYCRTLRPYINRNGKNEFLDDLRQFDNKEIGYIITNIIINARTRKMLSPPFFNSFVGTKITGEFKGGQYRIFVYRINTDEFLMLSVFKKKTNETPKAEFEKAGKRLTAYLNRQG